jgi:hypothetical protein
MFTRISAAAVLSVVLLGLSGFSPAHAATLNVRCGGHEGLTSVNAAIKALAIFGTQGSHVINVRGVCNENVVFQGVSHITLDGGNSATIVDLTGGAKSAILIDSSQEITINNLTASGTGQGAGDWDVIDCQNGSICRFNNVTVQNGSTGAGGIGVWAGSYMDITGGKAQDNKGWAGIIAGNGGRALVNGMASQGNWEGAASYHGAFLQMLNVTLSGNDARGMEVYNSGTASCNPCTINGNGLSVGGEGVNVRHSSSVSLVAQTTVTGNGGPGVTLSKLSSLIFDYGSPVVSGNLGAADIVCSPTYTVVTLNSAQVGSISGCP